MRILIFILFGLFTLNCFAIWNGIPVEGDAWPQVIRMKFDDSGCTGTMINEQWILTAGHCIETANRSNSGITIYYGAAGWRTVEFNYFTAVIYPKYKEGFADHPTVPEIQNDLALVKISSSLKEYLKIPAYLSLGVSSPDEIQKLRDNNASFLSVAMGAAYSGKGSNVEDHQKLFLPLNVVYYPEMQILLANSTMVGKGNCEGDSGGGLFVQSGGTVIQVGVLSGVSRAGKPECGNPETKAAYVFLNEEKLLWIRKTTGLQ